MEEFKNEQAAQLANLREANEQLCGLGEKR
jgi:hypothetical protein